MKLFDSTQFKGLSLKNRIAMASMGTNLADTEGFVTDEMIAYYTERAKGGAGLIMTELVTVDFPLGNGIERQLSIDDDKYIPGFQRLTSQIHQFGSKVFIQLNHAGSRAKPEFTQGEVPVSASPIPSSIAKIEPRPLTREEILSLIDAFGQAARRAKEAGFDGIDLHFAHGYLISQFLSSVTNKRTDRYGGNFENRARLALQVLERCRREVGKDFPISAKVVGQQYVKGGITVYETKKFCQFLQQNGIDAIQVSGGDPESSDHFPVPPMYSRRGCYVNLAHSIKKAVGIPVIAVGRINNVLLANQIIESGKADLVAMGRAFLADPDFPEKALAGKLEEIRMCIGCNQGCRGRDRTRYLTVGCVLNPRIGKEIEGSRIVPARTPKHVLVVGGGPSGMEAARVAALRGHEVTLFEKHRSLGGQLRLAARPPGRGEFRHLIQWYRNQMSKLGVKLFLGRKARVDIIYSLTPDTIIIATGSRPLFPGLEALNQVKVAYASEILEKKVQIGQRAVILGGGGVGLETADFLASKRKKVTVIEQLSEVGRDLEGSTKKALMARLARKEVVILTGATIDRVGIGTLCIRWNGSKKEIDVEEPLIIATGAEANLDLYKSLKKTEAMRNIDIYVIGDSASPRLLREAISEGYETSQNI
jgi:2,4-dienoyl-CoA reductase-like NADH-dependent reductase (Old Yellow Enzyme family)/thioredoxin reductase